MRKIETSALSKVLKEGITGDDIESVQVVNFNVEILLKNGQLITLITEGHVLSLIKDNK